MKQTVSSLLIAISVFLAACTPRDPLDWKIDGRNSNELQSWLIENTPRMPPLLADEFSTAIVRIRDDTHGWTTAAPTATNNPLSLRLHGRTVRDVLVEGLQLQAGDFLSRAQKEKMDILRIAQSLQFDDLSPTERRRFERQIQQLKRSSDVNERAFNAVEKRIKSLVIPADPI